jgi:Ca-activated chloride channel homolog
VSSQYRMPHYGDTPSRSRVRRRSRVGPGVAAGVAVLAVVAAGFGGYRLLSHPSCAGQIQLAVTVAPEIDPAVRATVQQWTATKPRVNGKCVAVQVDAADPADVAAAVAGRHKATLSGVGQPAGDIRVPNVWIPDSSTWLQRLRAAGPDWVPADASSVARSPVVLAVPQPVAATLAAPGKKLTWAGLLPKLTSDARLHPGIVDPNRDAASASGLLALAGAAKAADTAAGGSQQTTVVALRALAAGRSALRTDLLARFPRAADAGSLASALTAAPLPEQAVIGFNAGQPAVPLSALYVDPAPAALDYPLTVLPGATRDQAAAAQAVAVTLGGDTYRDRLAQVGLRAADGSTGAGFAAPKGAPAGSPPNTPAPDPAALGKLLSTWTALLAPGRILTVIDVSGSMARPVPAAGGATRDQVAVEAARRGLGLLDDTWAVGLWIFSTQLDGGNDWKELVPVGVLSGQRQQLAQALPTIQPKLNGGTGLYNTVLAAYKNVQASWDPGRVNSILIMTDGKNEDAPGLTLDQLIDQLKKTADPARPIEVIALGIGDQVSKPELDRITSTTGGATFLAPDPSKIGEIFIQALGLRPTAGR